MDNIALCISGDLRTVDRCLDNITSTIIDPLKSEFNVDVFISTWDNNISQDLIDLLTEKLSPKDFHIEPPMLNFFISNYSSNNYMKDSLMCQSTPYNATSMWYKAFQCKEVMLKYAHIHNVEYACVFRMRPDVVYNTNINLDMVKESITNNYIYMSKWHGKYGSVTLEMQDQFAFGSPEVMCIYLDTYSNIKHYIENNDLVHTGEGFLHEQIKNINLKRIDFSYSIQRWDKIDNIT